jgi:tRNA (guanine-N7-)-methyltransferase
MRVVRERVADATLSAVHIYFPDPWWKQRHRRRRIINEQFVGHIERILIPGGRLHFWTDVLEYFQTTLELVSRVSNLQGPWPVAAADPSHDFDYRTHFERRMRQHQEPVYRSEFAKAST